MYPLYLFDALSVLPCDVCWFQIKHGAVPHQSKEQMIASGRCRKPMGKRTYKKLRKCGAKQSDVTSLSTLISSLQMKDNEEEEKSNEDDRVQTAVDIVEGCGSGGEREKESIEECRDQITMDRIDDDVKNNSEVNEGDSSEVNVEKECQDVERSCQDIDKLPGFG